MEIEAIILAVAAPVVALPLTWLWMRQNSMNVQLRDTYTKDEAKEMIDLKQKPMQDAIERQTQVCSDLTKAITELRLELARTRKGDNDGKAGTGS